MTSMHRQKTPLVSVVIPVYNRPLAVRRAIESVRGQSCQDFEIIVVDDGSDGAVAATVAAIADPRLTVVRHDVNRGASAARNTGVRASSAPFVAFLDSDDEWMPTKLERQLEVFERSNDRLGLVYTGSEQLYADGSAERHIPRRHTELALALMTENVVGETSVGMLRRSTLESVGGFDESLPASQDVDLWLRVCEQFSADFVPEPLVRVAKGSDRGRISAMSDRTTRGRELFCRKHRDKLARRGVLYRYLRDSGWMYHREARDLIGARRCYRESLAVNSTAPLTYVLLALAFLPVSWLDRASRLKYRLSSLRRVEPGAWLRRKEQPSVSTLPQGTGTE